MSASLLYILLGVTIGWASAAMVFQQRDQSRRRFVRGFRRALPTTPERQARPWRN